MSALRFLILSASTGSGHTSASNALKEEVEARGGVVEVIDCMDHVAPMFRRWFKGGYEMLVRNQPWFWGHLYRTSDRPLFNYQIQTFLDYACSKPIDDYIRDFKPDFVVCAHSVAQPRLPRLRTEMGFQVAVVVTDLYPHRMWLRGDPDLFFVPTEESKEVLQRRLRRDPKPVEVTGIPVNRAFHAIADRAESRMSLGFHSKRPLVVLSSGGIGAGPFDAAVADLAKLEIDVAVLCGRARATKDRLEGIYRDTENVRILGQISQSEMGVWLGSADLLVGKSGGLTTFEALASECPFLVLWPFLIPGQEEDNAEWLEDVGAGCIEKDLAHLGQAVEALVGDKARLLAMRHAARRHSKPDAAKAIVDRLYALGSPIDHAKVAVGENR